ncbi:hypothetical protein MYSTI_06955 [Myxococcus stipitatus DSM 14675]|uniref:Lipoprotein n=1 Tax=Myxococcus stipitatus (strain DSM 14675 / JCM 12634 / Mx s8) TaxID=1278073 RepID=L7UL14_MYXSD|nr:hypothetical protein [Myxococcus stipitatus]AGC48227.1 hypothetical protein MYSTI_06955 [Myxococcus stipitatus DSM 14675]
MKVLKGLWVVGFLVGCGGAEPEQVSAEELISGEEQATVSASSGPDVCFGHWAYFYYSNATMTSQVGGDSCVCNVYSSWGTTTMYRKQALVPPCTDPVEPDPLRDSDGASSRE